MFWTNAAAKIRSTVLQSQSDPAAVPEGKIQFPPRCRGKKAKRERQKQFFNQ